MKTKKAVVEGKSGVHKGDENQKSTSTRKKWRSPKTRKPKSNDTKKKAFIKRTKAEKVTNKPKKASTTTQTHYFQSTRLIHSPLKTKAN